MKKNILITGGTGFIGRALVPRLAEDNYKVTILTRNPDQQVATGVNLITSLEEIADSSQIYGVINLAGEPLAKNRWTEQRKKMFLNSRIDVTRALIKLVHRLQVKPKVFLSSSAIGYYGPQNDIKLNEDSEPVESFSHSLCTTWEKCANEVRIVGPRVCLMRIGVVFGSDGGPLETLSKSFRWKIATQLGAGNQWVSWIHIDDLINGIIFLLRESNIQGPINFTSVEPITNKSLSALLSKQFKTWINVVVPSFVMRILVGEMADEILLTGQRVVPEKLRQSGFVFQYSTIEEAFKKIYD